MTNPITGIAQALRSALGGTNSMSQADQDLAAAAADDADAAAIAAMDEDNPQDDQAAPDTPDEEEAAKEALASGEDPASDQGSASADDKPRSDPVVAERSRWQRVLEDPRSKGREATAINLLSGDMDADKILSALETVPVVSAGAAARLDGQRNPQILGTDEPGGNVGNNGWDRVSARLYGAK